MESNGNKSLSFLRLSARNIINTVGMVIITILISFSLVFMIITDYVRKYMIDELLEQTKAISRLETMREDRVWDQRTTTYYEELTGATVMYMDTTVTYQNNEAWPSEASPREIIQLDIMEGDEENMNRIYIWDTLEQYDFHKILDGECVAEIRSFTFSEDDIIFAGAPVYDSSGAVIGGIVLVQETDVIDEQTDSFLKVMLIAAGVSITLAFVVSLLENRRLSVSIGHIIGGAQRLAEGHYGEAIRNRRTGTELDVLTGTLNTLSWRLDNVFNSHKQEQEKLNLILDTLNEGIIAVDWHMNVIHYNHPFLEILEMQKIGTRLTLDSEAGKRLYESMRSRDRVSHKWIAENGRHLEIVASPLFGNGKMIIGAVGVVVDVSEQDRLEQLRRDYVANISHELRTPLTGIRGMVEPLMDDIFETNEERHECYDVIYQETLHLEKLIGDMLDMSRLQDGRLVIDMENICLDGILDFAMHRISKSAEEAGIKLVLDIGEGNIGVLGNEERVLQVITIFLDNALNFTPSGGIITISARSRKKDVYVSVTDTGCGIEPKDIPYIWERFYKSDKSRMRTPGTGLGLAIAKLVVELMNGTIGVNSRPGEGTEFWFTLKK